MSYALPMGFWYSCAGCSCCRHGQQPNRLMTGSAAGDHAKWQLLDSFPCHVSDILRHDDGKGHYRTQRTRLYSTNSPATILHHGYYVVGLLASECIRTACTTLYTNEHTKKRTRSCMVALQE